MPTNANVYNSRVTSETLEEQFRRLFPSQGGAELNNDLFAQGVIVPTVDLTSAAEGSVLPVYLQQAWDIGTTQTAVPNVAQTSNITTTPGFYRVSVQITAVITGSAADDITIRLTDGVTNTAVWKLDNSNIATNTNVWLGIVTGKPDKTPV